ncbi:MAG: hypothetical protein ACKVQK_04600, partial [Burkholderiales bacterium]
KADIQDLAAYLAQPLVASPRLAVSTKGPAANSYTTERLEFRATAGASSPITIVRLTNTGDHSLRLLSAPILAGQNAQDFSVSTTDCLPDGVLVPQAFCEIGVVFRARTFSTVSPATLFVANLRVEHDWIGGGVTLALLGHVSGAPVRRNPPMISP